MKLFAYALLLVPFFAHADDSASLEASLQQQLEQAMNQSAEEQTDALDIFQTGNISDMGLTGTKTIALTFDDGPSGITPKVLDILRANGVKAVFFQNGVNFKGREGTMKRIFNEGHLFANHTEAHTNLTTPRNSSPAALVNAVNATYQKQKEYLRSSDMLLFRAPEGAWKSANAKILNANPELRKYIGPIFWNIGGALKNGYSADWDCWRKGLSVQKCLNGYIAETNAHSGGVVLMHDRFAGTAAMLDSYIKTFKAKGYRFIRLDDAPKLQRYR